MVLGLSLRLKARIFGLGLDFEAQGLALQSMALTLKPKTLACNADLEALALLSLALCLVALLTSVV